MVFDNQSVTNIDKIPIRIGAKSVINLLNFFIISLLIKIQKLHELLQRSVLNFVRLVAFLRHIKVLVKKICNLTACVLLSLEKSVTVALVTLALSNIALSFSLTACGNIVKLITVVSEMRNRQLFVFVQFVSRTLLEFQFPTVRIFLGIKTSLFKDI